MHISPNQHDNRFTRTNLRFEKNNHFWYRVKILVENECQYWSLLKIKLYYKLSSGIDKFKYMEIYFLSFTELAKKTFDQLIYVQIIYGELI